MYVWDDKAGRFKFVLSREEFLAHYHRWQNLPETKALFARIDAENEEMSKKVLAEIAARNAKQK